MWKRWRCDVVSCSWCSFEVSMHCSSALQANKCPSIMNSNLIVIFKYFSEMKYFLVIERGSLHTWMFFCTGDMQREPYYLCNRLHRWLADLWKERGSQSRHNQLLKASFFNVLNSYRPPHLKIRINAAFWKLNPMKKA